MDERLSLEHQRKVAESLMVNKETQETVQNRLQIDNQNLQLNWNQQSYYDHQAQFEQEYYPIWTGQDTYQKKLASIPEVRVEGALDGDFVQQEQPEEKFFWKSRHQEEAKIAEYRKQHTKTKACFDKNTVREMSELDKYRSYHADYFRKRQDQNALRNEYLNQEQDISFAKKCHNGISLQEKKFISAFGESGGPVAELKKSIRSYIFDKKQEFSRETEMDEGLSAFFTMTKGALFWKKQVGQLGTESREELKDASAYNKRLLTVYTKGNAADRAGLLDELADKLLKFKLTPNMFTNKYMAKNMLQMQRYTDMLRGFVTLSKYNPEYLDVENEKAAHTSPEKAAMIRSRILLMAPIMEDFMQKHAAYFGYQKKKGLAGSAEINAEASSYENENSYNDFVRETWGLVKAAYNSSADFLGDFANVQLEGAMKEVELQTTQNREARKEKNKGTDQDDSMFDIKYDLQGEKAKLLLRIQNRISSNPQIYDIFGMDMDRLFGRVNEMARRLDELETRSGALRKMREDPAILKDKGIENFHNMWKTYVDKEVARLNEEHDILWDQLKNYENTVCYLTDQNLNAEDLSLTDPPAEVAGVLKYENMNYVLDIKKITEYNDLLYKTLDFYDFQKYDSYTDKDGKKVAITDLRAQYNYTVLKRGVERARKVNRMDEGKTTVDIRDVSKLNAIERRNLCSGKYDEFAKKVEETPSKYTYSAIDVVTADMEQLTKEYNLTGDLDITLDKTYEQYFQVKSIADMANKLDKDPSGAAIEGYDKLSESQKDELRIRTRLFRDYFRRWEGRMEYTRSEAYAYLYDTDDMQGNNEIIPGIDKRYRKNTFSDMLAKVNEKYDKESDGETKEKLGELQKFLGGMVLENDYDTKSIKAFDKDAYMAYKTAYQLEKKRETIKNTYIKDSREQRIKGIITLEPGSEEIDRKIETALTLQNGIDRYVAKQKEELGRYGIENVTAMNVEQTNLFFSDMQAKTKEKGRELTDSEKSEIIRSHYQRFVDIVSKMDTDYCSDTNILENLPSVLSELKYARDFNKFLKHNDGENFELLKGSKDYRTSEADDLERYDHIVKAVDGYVHCILLDHGIKDIASHNFINSRDECKRALISGDRKYIGDFIQASKELDTVLAQEKEKDAKDKEVREELAEIEKLYREEQALIGQMNKEASGEGKQVGQEAKDGVKSLKVHSVNPYEKRYRELLKKRRSEEEAWDGFKKVLYHVGGFFGDKIELEETKDGERVDYITDTKAKNLRELQNLLDAPTRTKSRNYVEELFRYIQKQAGDRDMNNPEVVTEVLKKAKDAYFFTLSGGARREAGLRLEEFERNKTAMRDFFLWQNTQVDNEVLKDRARVFGQDAFVEKNVDNIRIIMDSIAEANASVNDMQTPEFLDSLKDTLEVKGIDERQFMFLMRRHNVGTSGLSNTLKDAEKAKKNTEDVRKYLDVQTRDDFLLKTANEVTNIGDILKPENLNEAYILKHFEECYFTANRLIAFQQLYYGEKDAFDTLKFYPENRDLFRKIDRLFEKGHGEPYALYYNVVMSIANKYGVSAGGALNFGLPVEEVEKLGQTEKPARETADATTRNLNEAEKQSGEAFKALETALRRNKMMLQMQPALDASLASVEVEKRKRSRYGSDGTEKTVQDLSEFYNAHANTYNLAKKYLDDFHNQYENNPLNVSYTKTDFFVPQFLFFMAKDQAFDKATDKISNMDTTLTFQNFFQRNKKTVGKNLTVVDTEKCKRAMSLVRNMSLDTGKFEKTGKGFAFDEEWLNENFTTDFYEDIINAQNFCMMFEMNKDYMRIDSYEEEVENRRAEGKDEFVSIYEQNKANLDEMNKQKDALYDQYGRENQLHWKKKSALARAEAARQKASPDELEKLDANIRDLAAEVEAIEKKKNEIDEQLNQLESDTTAIEEKLDIWLEKAGMEDYGVVSMDKLKVLKGARQMFSDNKTRFMVSTYFNYVSAYMLKNGISLAGEYTNLNTYNELLKERSQAGFSSQTEALDLGDQISAAQNEKYQELFNMQRDYILKGTYAKDYQALLGREKEKEKKLKELKKLAMEADKQRLEGNATAERKREEEEKKKQKEEEKQRQREEKKRQEETQKLTKEAYKKIAQVKKEVEAAEKAERKRKLAEEKAEKKKQEKLMKELMKKARKLDGDDSLQQLRK